MPEGWLDGFELTETSKTMCEGNISYDFTRYINLSLTATKYGLDNSLSSQGDINARFSCYYTKLSQDRENNKSAGVTPANYSVRKTDMILSGKNVVRPKSM